MSLETIVEVLRKVNSYPGEFNNILEIDHPSFNELIEIIIYHNKFDYSDKSLKNYVVKNITQTSDNPKNQISSASPITFGEYENIKKEKDNSFVLSLFDGLSMFQQQQSNAVGGEVIGIAANGIKDYFALVTYFSKHFYNNNEIEKTSNEYFDRSFTLFGKEYRVNRIAGLNLEEKSVDILNNYIGIKKVINNLNTENDESVDETKFDKKILDSNTDPSLVLSSLLSAATDNAKELILKAINAGKEFASMHIYMIILGFDEGVIAKFMTSPDILKLMKKFKSNVFSLTKDPNINTIINGIEPEESVELNEFKKIYNLSKELSYLAGNLKINQGLKANQETIQGYFKNIEKNFITREIEFVTEAYKLSNKPKKQNAFDYLDDLILQDKPYLESTYIKKVIDLATEFNIPKGNFSFELFFSNGQYRKVAIDYYNLIKGTFNILDITSKLDNFNSMIKATKLSYDTLKGMSKKFSFPQDVVEKVLEESNLTLGGFKIFGTTKVNLKEDHVKNSANLFDDLVISKWFKDTLGSSKKYSFNLLDLQNLTNEPVKYYDSKGTINDLGNSDQTIDFTEDLMLINFKTVMENNILPYLKKNYSDNSFINGLVLRSNTGKTRS